MPGETIKIASSAGGAFDCYLALPAAPEPVPAVVLASAVHGVDKDLRAIADAFAAHGYIAAAPDLFWRTLPGPLTRAEATSARRTLAAAAEKIKAGEADIADTLADLRKLQGVQRPRRRACGFCYGGPYAIIGPKRLGYRRRHFLPRHAHAGLHRRARRRHRARLHHLGRRGQPGPADVLDAYRAVPARMSNVELHIFPGIKHGYMMPDAGAAHDAKTREFSMQRAFALLDSLRGGGERMRKAS